MGILQENEAPKKMVRPRHFYIKLNKEWLSGKVTKIYEETQIIILTKSVQIPLSLNSMYE